MEIYGFWRSQATFRLRVALNLKGIGYREIPVDIDKGGQDTPEFRAISPMGAVPAVPVEGGVLTQSLAILEYLDEIHPAPPLLPADALGRARVRALAAVAAADTHPLIVPRVRTYLMTHAGFDAARWKAWQANWFTKGLQGLEARLAGDGATGDFCHGDKPGIADICLAGLVAGVRAFAIDVPGIPTVEGIAGRCMGLPAFDAARADRQADFPG